MTWTLVGSSAALRTVFSLEVLLTQMTLPTSDSENLISLFVRIELMSANPNREWSVKTQGIPRVRACKIPSWHIAEKAEWP